MNTSSYSRGLSGAPGIRSLALAWALFGLGLALVYPSADWQATVGVLMVSQAFCGALAWRRLRMTAAAVLPDFLTLFLLMQFVNKSLTALGQIVIGYGEAAGRVGEYLSIGESVPTKYMYQAELVFLLATALFTLTCRLLERSRRPPAVWQAPAAKVMWWTYGLSLVAHLVLSYSPSGSSLGITQELMKFFSVGALAVLLGGRTDYALGGRRSWLPILALMPLYVLALRSGMKGEVALVSLAILLPAVRHLNLNRSLLLGGFVVLVVLFVFPFSQAWRQANWAGYRGYENADISTVASRVLSSWEQDGLLETAAASTAQWLSRGSSAEAGGLVMQLAERDGLIGPILIEGLTTIFIPRFLWPDKPLYMPGAWFTWYLGDARSPETATSSTAMMLPTELYWMFGILGVLIGMPLLGMLYFYIWKYLIRRAVRGLVSSVALFALLTSSAALESTHAIYAISGPIILLVYVVVYDCLKRLFFPGLSPMAVRKPASS